MFRPIVNRDCYHRGQLRHLSEALGDEATGQYCYTMMFVSIKVTSCLYRLLLISLLLGYHTIHGND